jgi:hypothetical protein
MSKKIDELKAKFEKQFKGYKVEKEQRSTVDEKGKEVKHEVYKILDNKNRCVTRGIYWRGLVDEKGVCEAMTVLLNSDWKLWVKTPYLMKRGVVCRLMKPQKAPKSNGKPEKETKKEEE